MYSTPLLILVLQGLIFAFLLGRKYLTTKHLPYGLLCLVLLITCWHRTTYTIGFMGWYDTFRNTKINYYLIPFSLALGPLLYLYVKSVTVSGFRLVREHCYHFIPFVIYFLYRVFILVYDASQAGYLDTQNGVLMSGFHETYVEPIYTLLSLLQRILYLAFTFQAYFLYRDRIKQFYSNTYSLELNWLRNFLYIYTFLFIYGLGQTVVNDQFVDLHWTQEWWEHFFSGLAIIYVGIKGYFTDTQRLDDLAFNTVQIPNAEVIKSVSKGYQTEMEHIKSFFAEDCPYLNPDLTLKTLARELNYSTNQLSEIINSGFQMNFNDFINGYRVDAVKAAFEVGKHKSMSLLGVALDCGFNSKPTFNRVFKKITGLTPSQYLNSK